jgi:hypothetical protein
VSHGSPGENAPSIADPVAEARQAEHELLTTLFDLGRRVTAVLDFDTLLAEIPRLIGA